jgi:TRAP-type C4-dicarboxylate transport system permease small subunit
MLAVWGLRLAMHAWDVPMAGATLPQGSAFLPLCVGGALIALFALDNLVRAADLRPPGD